MSTESQGNPAPQTGQGGASGASSEGGAKGFSFDSEEQFNQRLNAAIGGRLKEFGVKIDGRFGELQNGLTTAFGSKFDEFGKLLEGLKPSAPDKGKDPAQPTFKLEDSPEWKASQAEISALKKKTADAEASTAQERAKNRAASLRATLSEQLAKHGVPADRIKLAVGHLISAEQLVGYSDDGKGDAIVYRDGDVNEVSLDAGLKSFLRTGDGKVFLPAQNPGGSGGGPNGRGAAPPDKNDPRAPLRAAVRNLLNGDSE
jgi:hypothetical protein